MKYIELSDQPLEADKIIQLVEDPGAGSVNVFIGTVRNQTKNKPVTKLEFEAYEPMAISEMEKIADKAIERWPILNLAIFHRIGSLSIGEIPVIIAVSTPHRAHGFEACQYIIDTLKQTVPIWKKEFFDDGEQWVAAHP